MQWEDVPQVMDDWALKCAAPAEDLRRGTETAFTHGPVAIYYNPEAECVALAPGCEKHAEQDFAIVKLAAEQVVGLDQVVPVPLTRDDLHDPEQSWVKVAYSPTLRTFLDYMNFTPGHYPGGIPNQPSPLAGTLTGGLVGAGLGYGLGWLGEKFMPDKWEEGKLRRSLGIIGGLAGAAPGALWMGSALSRGKSVLDGSDFYPPPGAPLHPGSNTVMPNYKFTQGADQHPWFTKAAAAFTSFGAWAPPEPKTPISVNVNALGQTLWECGANPQTTAATMGAVYGASQMPDPNASPGEATPHQMGLFGTLMGAAGGGLKGYAAGWGVGKALGLLTGMPPETQNTLKSTGAVLGIVHELASRLF